MDIVKRREEKYSKANPESLDISTVTIKSVFNEDKNLRNLVRLIIITSQKKNQMKFDNLVRPINNL